jgi:hypothetical protein
MKPFIKPILWATGLSLLLLTIGLYGIDRPVKRTNTGHTMVTDTTHSLDGESAGMEHQP